MGQPMTLAYIDGASRGNPGPASTGVVIVEGDTMIYERGSYLGVATNNVAEYSALIEALIKLRELGKKRVEIRSDSELLVRQLAGQYKVKAEGLKPLYLNAVRLLNSFDEVCVTHVPRERNSRADRLANRVLDDLLGQGEQVES